MLRDVSRYFEMLREVSVKLLRVQAGSNPWLDDVAHLVQHCGRGWNLMTWQTEWRDSMWGCWIAIGPCLHEVVSTCLNMIQHDSTWFSMVWFDVYSLAFIWQQQYECSWCRIIDCLIMFEHVWTCLSNLKKMNTRKIWNGLIEATHWNHGGHSSQLYAFSLWGSGYTFWCVVENNVQYCSTPQCILYIVFVTELVAQLLHNAS